MKTKITWIIFNLYTFSNIKENSCCWAMNIKSFGYSSLYSSLAMKLERRTFDSSHQIYCRRQIWPMELVASVETKLYCQLIHCLIYCYYCVMFVVLKVMQPSYISINLSF